MKPTWRESKERYIARIASEEAATVLVSASDKLAQRALDPE
jgi:hypothetical protein